MTVTCVPSPARSNDKRRDERRVRRDALHRRPVRWVVLGDDGVVLGPPATHPHHGAPRRPDPVRRRRRPVLLDVAREPEPGLLDVGQDREDVLDRAVDGDAVRAARHTIVSVTRLEAVVFDAGETLIDETRTWEAVADAAGIPRFTFMAALGGLIAAGRLAPRGLRSLRRVRTGRPARPRTRRRLPGRASLPRRPPRARSPGRDRGQPAGPRGRDPAS